MPCILCRQFEDAKQDADRKILQSPLYGPDYHYWVLQSAQFRTLIETHRKTCGLCADSSWQIAS
jgi:hypothetical protein